MCIVYGNDDGIKFLGVFIDVLVAVVFAVNVKCTAQKEPRYPKGMRAGNIMYGGLPRIKKKMFAYISM